MAAFHEVVNISDEEDSDGSMYDFGRDFSANDNEIGQDVEAMDIDRPSDSGSNGIRTLFDTYETCLNEILEVFPDISHDHVRQIYDRHVEIMGPYERQDNTVAQSLVEKILDSGNYPKERDRIRELKRKRSDKNSDDEEAAKWKYMDLRNDPAEYAKVAKVALHEAFEYVPAKYIQEVFKEHGHYYGAFFTILEAERDYDPGRNPAFMRLKTRRVTSGLNSTILMANLEMAGHDFEALKKEMDSAFQRKKREEAKRKAGKEIERAEAARTQQHIANGEIMDCGCCFETVTIPQMTHCNGEEPHFCCIDCARRNAESDIGKSQYKLQCVVADGCKATFSREQKARFLDEMTIEKLERLQQQDEIRLAELENLSTCPFCDFAAICPPIDEDREFRCHNPPCQEVSCRLCKLKSHLPLTCEEHKKENGISERRVIEEARTEALIRTCGKCNVRILKEDGCNKVICTSCYAVLCDYCGKDISKQMYNHFDGEGGRAPPGLITAPGGKCPLYDESNKRKDRQVDAAEKEAMAKVRAEHPELSEEDLKIKFAKEVQNSPSRNRHHRMRHVWDPQEVLPHVLNNFGPIPPILGPFGQNLPGAQADVVGQGPAGFAGRYDEQLRQHVARQQLHMARQQQEAAYQAMQQAQQQRQLAEHERNLLRVHQQRQVVEQAQAHMAQQQAHAQAHLPGNPRAWVADGPYREPFGADGAFGHNGVLGANAQFGHNSAPSANAPFEEEDPFALDLLERLNGPGRPRLGPQLGPANNNNERNRRIQAETVAVNARRARAVDKQFRETEERMEAGGAALPPPRAQPPQEPRRRNAIDATNSPWFPRFHEAPTNNPWM